MIKGFKIRIFPTPEQENHIQQHIDCCRATWNMLLGYNINYFTDCKKSLYLYDLSKILTQMKHTEDYKWMNKVSAQSLQKICKDLSDTLREYTTGKARLPRFKSKKFSKQAYPVSPRLSFSSTYVQIEKLGKVKYQTNLYLPLGKGNKFMNPRISKQGKKWILSLSMECENQAYQLIDTTMGIDLGIKELAVVSFGDSKLVFHNINKTPRVKRLESKLKHLQRTVSRKYEVGNKLHPDNKYLKTGAIKRYEELTCNIYRKLSNIRKNYLHQTTHMLVSKLPRVVGMETLNVIGMMKNRHLANRIQKQGFYEFYRQMQYKCKERGIILVQADRFYPSSKTCSHCGHIKKDLKLSDRTYRCPKCGMELDRDYNAAINLAHYAGAILETA